MSVSGRLLAEADQQIGELLAQLTRLDDPRRLNAPCPGREKLGAGTIAAHGHAPALALDATISRLSTARDALTVLDELDDNAANAVPNAGAIRFADGERTLSQVVSALLRHQGHQVEAVRRAISDAP